MRVLLVCNPRSGRGRSESVAQAVARDAAARRWSAEVVGVEAPDLRQRAEGCDVVVVAGGDGTVRSVAGQVLGIRAPLAIVPTGTENLAAREHGFMVPAPVLLEAIQARGVREVDVGLVNGECFLVMASVGFDASVVEAVQAARKGPITRWSYAWPVVQQVLAWRGVGCRVLVDGRLVFEGAGQVVVANSPHYAARLNPVRWAHAADGKLDVLVLPAASSAGLVWWA
ncbi:MAG: diacylglycerol kinase family protein, partial [Phycisphaerales bacterium]